MSHWPDPVPGLVIRYSYLWRREADQGREEGVKDRPCAIVAAARNESGGQTVYVLPITHSSPIDHSEAVELPQQTILRLGLDGLRSWVVISEANRFSWPGPDLRPLPGMGLDSAGYGFLPPRFFKIIRDKFVEKGRHGEPGFVTRTE